MPVVGEAVVLVRVISNRLADDIRDAVKRGMKDADKDIDAEGKKAGERLGKSMGDSAGDSIKRDMERTVGKEVVLATRRLAITAGNGGDDAGRNWGTRFLASAGNGIRDNESIIGRQLSESMVRAFTSDDDRGLSRIGNQLGGNFTRAIGRGAEDAAPDIRADMNRWLGRELTAGPKNEIVRAADVDGKLFMRNLVEGMRTGEADFNDRLRRTMANSVRDQEADLQNNMRRVFVSSLRGAAPEVSTEFRRVMRDAVNDVDSDSETRGRWRSYVRNVVSSLSEAFQVEGTRLRQAGQRLNDNVRQGIDDRREQVANAGDRLINRVEQGMLRRFPRTVALARQWGQQVGAQFGNGTSEREGENAADRVTRGVRRGMNRNRAGLGSLFSGIGNELFKHFNLGFGAARMGSAIISVLATAAPSILSGLGAIITALVGDLVNLMSALGPGLGGAIGVGIAGVSSLALNMGLLMAAFKLSGTVLDQFTKDFKAFGELIGTPIAQGMLTGLNEMLVSLRDTLLPQVNDLLTVTGERFGALASNLGRTLAGEDNIRRIREILTTNLTFIDNLSAGIDGLVTSFLTLFAASKPFIDYIGQGVKNFGEWAAASLAVSEANGNLGRWMDGMLASFRDLWAITKNFGSGIGNIFSAAAPAGESLLGSIRGIAERFRAWTSDEGNMAKMTAFFEKARTLSSAVLDLLGGIFTAGGNAFAAMDLGPITSVLTTLQTVVAPAIARLFNQIQTGASDNLVRAFENIGTALTKIADSGNFVKVADLIGTIIEKITEFAATDFGSTILSWVIPLALMGGIVTSLIGPLLSLGSGLATMAASALGGSSALGGLAAAAAPIVAIAVAIAAAFALIYANSESFRTALSDLASTVGGAFMAAWEMLSPKLTEVWGKLQELASAIGDRLAPVIQFLAPIVADAVRFIGELFSNILDAIGGFIDIITGILTGDWGKIWSGVVQVLGAAWDQIKTIFAIALSIVSYAWDAITTVVYNVGQVIYGIVTSVWTGIWNVIQTIATAIWDFLKAGWALLVEFLGAILTGAVGAVVAIFTGLWDAIVTIWNGIYAFFETILTTIYNAIYNFGNSIPPFLEGIWNGISNIAVAVWNGIYAFFETVLTTIYNAIYNFGNAIPPFLAGIWNGIKNTASTIWNAIVGVATTVWNAITGAIRTVVETIAGWLSDRWADIKTAVSVAWNGLASTVSTVWGGIKNAIVQPIIDAWNSVTEWVDKIAGVVRGILSTVASAVTTVNTNLASIMADQVAATSVSESMLQAAGPGQTPSILSPEGIGGGVQRMLMEHVMNIPGLATGGIVPAISGGSVFRLGEGGKSERVEPLDSSGLSVRDRAMIKSIVASTVSMMSGGGVNVDVQIGEQGLSQFVTQTIRRENDSLARRVGKVRR